MGLFAEWVATEFHNRPREAAYAGLANEGVRGEVELDGWLFARTRGHDPDALVERLVRVDPELAIAGWVHDSDFAYLTGFGRNGRRFSILVGTPYSDSADEEELPESLSRLASIEGRKRSAEDLAEWSTSNGLKSPSASDVVKVIERDWTFAEEGVASLARQVGLPDLDRALAALSAPTGEAGVVVSLPVHKLASLAAFSLLDRLSRFSQEQGIGHEDERSIELQLPEASTDAHALDELLAEVQRWVDDLGGLDYITVFARGKAYRIESKVPWRIG